jgi:hypothetical protein
MIKNAIPDYYMPQVKSGLATIKIAEIAVYTECQFLVLSRDALCQKCVSGMTFNVFDRSCADKPFTADTVDNYCHYGKKRGMIVIGSTSDHAKSWRYRIDGEKAAEYESSKKSFQATDMTRSMLLDLVIHLLQDPLVTVDRTTYYGACQPEQLPEYSDSIILEIPWIIRSDNFVLVNKDDRYILDRLSTIDSAGLLLEQIHHRIDEQFHDDKISHIDEIQLIAEQMYDAWMTNTGMSNTGMIGKSEETKKAC